MLALYDAYLCTRDMTPLLHITQHPMRIQMLGNTPYKFVNS